MANVCTIKTFARLFFLLAVNENFARRLNVKYIALIHNGKAEIISSPGNGAEFRII